MKSTAIILLNLGGPDSLRAVRPFLYNLFSDREIIRLGPSLLQKPIAWLISATRSPKTRGYYKLIGGKSPILDITRAQADALERLLNAEGRALPVYIGMRYWHPFIEDTLKELNGQGIKRLLSIGLYPHYSKATTGSSLNKFDLEMTKYNIEHHSTGSWFDNPFYIDALVEVIKKGLEKFGTGGDEVHILFSAHSLPQKFIEEGDPYVNEIMGTIRQVLEKLKPAGDNVPLKWHLSYQSKSGPVKWLEPSTEETLDRLSKEGVRNVLAVPISFVSDHIETLYEIDILYKGMAEAMGMRLERAASLNTHPLFIEALKDIALRGLKEAGWLI